ncbi:hypothetical protein K435DRAFT_799360 [Dendrothele bispora CBS 962.96]|uniref:Uncharacterized protein n=1 Tax=Dendrothele bispora (strain CBS 962.96) TaxID=1314807 RepID=A0A4S8LIE7_DENBC|nr:hypothetical protein K435DRAFT_916346 [Dendrothele bispora CBS 962.96]THU93904.1 hypothetical protein K435DRAFT_799360 [Dendrothele bispora CBS 962.96]
MPTLGHFGQWPQSKIGHYLFQTHFSNALPPHSGYPVLIDYYKCMRLSPSASGSTLPAKKRPRVIVRKWKSLSTEERHRWKCLAMRLASERNDTDLNDFESDGSHGNDANDVGSTTGDLSSAAEYPGGRSRNFGNIRVYKEQVNQTCGVCFTYESDDDDDDEKDEDGVGVEGES